MPDRVDAPAEPVPHQVGEGGARPADDDRALLDRLRRKDRQSLTMIVQQHSPMLTRAAWLYIEAEQAGNAQEQLKEMIKESDEALAALPGSCRLTAPADPNQKQPGLFGPPAKP